MALSIQIDSITQSNDNKTIKVKDGTGIYNAVTNTGGWGSPNPAVTVIDGSTYHLYLDIVYTNSDGTETTYDQIELYTSFGPFSDVTDLEFDITPNLLVSGGTPMASSGEEFLDGWYKFTYSFVDDGSTYTDSDITTEKLIDGIVRVKTYNTLKDVPYINSYSRFNNDFKEWKDILYPLYYFALLEGMNAEAVVSRKNEVLSMLGTMETLLKQIS